MNKHDFIKLCRMTQPELKGYLSQKLTVYYGNVITDDGFVYAKGTDSVCLTAHLDTVHKQNVAYVKDSKGKISSPQGIGGDDRCGVYMILKILETTELRPTILFCEDEEIGGKGSQKFCKSKYIDDLRNMLFLIELDRANSNDLVFYDDVNDEFHRFCEKTTGYKEAYGSFSDISYLCPACKVSGVNISCGYYKAHTTSEYVVVKEMETSVTKTVDLIRKGIESNQQFEYKEDILSRYGNFDLLPRRRKSETEFLLQVIFYDYDGNEFYYESNSIKEAIANLMMDYPSLCWGSIMDYDVIY